MTENTRAIFAQRAMDSLTVAHHQGGWITTTIMANLFWPKSPTRKKYAERLMAEMIRQGLLLKRQLPNRMTAGVITANGCRYLNETFYSPGINVLPVDIRPGTDWGETKGGQWQPPASWQHQLRAGNFVSWAASSFSSPLSMLFDTQIQRANPTALKRPDGIAYKETSKGNIGVWIEVENARKTGEEMTKLVTALVDAYTGYAPQMFAYQEYMERIVVLCRQAALVVPASYDVGKFRAAVAKRLDPGVTLTLGVAKEQGDGTFSWSHETIAPL